MQSSEALYVAILNAVGTIAVRMLVTVTNDAGDVIASNTRPYVLAPGADLSDQPDDIKAVAAAWWTDARVADYQARVAEGSL